MSEVVWGIVVIWMLLRFLYKRGLRAMEPTTPPVMPSPDTIDNRHLIPTTAIPPEGVSYSLVTGARVYYKRDNDPNRIHPADEMLLLLDDDDDDGHGD